MLEFKLEMRIEIINKIYSFIMFCKTLLPWPVFNDQLENFVFFNIENLVHWQMGKILIKNDQILGNYLGLSHTNIKLNLH